MKQLLKSWLEKLAKANEESFGSGPLDCCQLNVDSKIEKTNSKKTTNNKNMINKID